MILDESSVGNVVMRRSNIKTFYSLILFIFLIGCNQPLYVDTAAYTEDFSELNSSCKSYTVSGFHEGNGTPSDPYVICKALHLDILRDKLIDDYANFYNKHFVVREDIDYKGSVENPFYAIGDIYDYELVDLKTAPNSKPFQGTFDGNGKTISGLYTEGPNFAYHGLFQYLGDQAVVKNLTINFYFNLENANYFIGGIAGYSEGEIENVNVFGVVTGDEILVGGLVAGFQKNNNFINSTVAGHVQSSLGSELGGVFGSASNATIDDITIPASVSLFSSTVMSKIDGATSVGGIVGRADTDVTISNITNRFEIICSDQFCGGFVGLGINNIVIENASNRSKVFSTGDYVGGFAGRIQDGDISNVVNYGGGTIATNTVKGVNQVGGIIGDSNNVVFNNVDSLIQTSCDNSFCGGIAGVATESEFYDVEVYDSVTGSADFIGGFVGSASASYFSDIYINSNITGQNYIAGVIGQSDGDVELINIIYDGNINASGEFAGGLIGKALDSTIADNVIINNASVNGLSKISLGIGYYENSTANISSLTNFNISGDATGEQFIGGIVGYGKNKLFVSDIDLDVNIEANVNSSNAAIGGDYAGGAFGKFVVETESARFQNININSPSLISVEKNYLGGLCGYCEGSIIIDSVFSQANILGVTGKVGGLVGHMKEGSIVNSQVNASSGVSSGVTTSANNVGGLVGYLEFGNILKSSVANGTIFGYGNIGGLVGYSNSSTLNQCFASTTIFSNGSYSGGLIGRMFSGYLANSYAAGNVNLGTGNFKAGLIGDLSSSSTILNAFSYGVVSNVNGGAIANSDSSSTISGLVWNTTTSTSTSSAEGSGYSTTQMLTTNPYAGYDFSTIWNLPSGANYPTLQ